MTDWYFSNLVLIQTTCIYVLLALSFQVVLRSGVFSFASVGFYGIGGYAVAILSIRGVSGWIGLAVALAIALVGGLILALLLARLRGLYLALVTVAFDLILTIIATNAGALTGGPVGLYGVVPILSVGTLISMAVIAILVVRRLEVGAFARAFEALRTDEQLARSTGQPVARYRATVFTLSAVLGAAAGAANVLVFTTVTPDTASFHLVTTGLTMAVLGGISRWQGAVVGAVLLAWMPALLGPFGEYQLIINGLVIVLITVWAPGGIVGLVERGYRAVRARGRGPIPPAEPDPPVPAASAGGEQR